MTSSAQREGEVGFKKWLKSEIATVKNERKLTGEIEKDCQAALRVHLELETINSEWHSDLQ